MIGKIAYGNTFSGVVAYSMQQHKGEVLDKNMLGNTPEEISKEFEKYTELNPRCKNPVARYIIGISQDDAAKLSNNQLSDIAKEYLTKMGYNTNVSPFLCVAHTDTQSKHLHVITCRIDPETKKTINSSYDYFQSRKACKALEEKYDLTKTRELRTSKEKQQEAGQTFNKEKASMAERKAKETQLKASPEYENIKAFLRIAVKQSLNESSNEIQLSAKLAEKGIQLESNSANNGYKFNYNGVNFKASEVSRDLSYAKINEQFRRKEKENTQSNNLNVEHIKQKTMENQSKQIETKSSVNENTLERIARLKKENEQSLNTDKRNEQENSLGYDR